MLGYPPGYDHSSPKIDVESLILMIEHVLVSILSNLTRATLLSLRNHINITIYIILYYIYSNVDVIT